MSGVLDALTVVASAADMVTDLLVLVQFYLDDQSTLFIMSLVVIALAQVTFALTFTIERTDVKGSSWKAQRQRALVFVCVFPFAQLVPILAYLTSTFELRRLQRVLRRLGVGGESEPRAPGTTGWERVKNKVHAHRGFLLEAFAEAIPQCSLQLVAALTVGHFTSLSAVSIFLSIVVIASKSWVVAWSPHGPTMAFNCLCIVADIVGFFACLAWLFAVDALPAVHVLHTSLRGAVLAAVALSLLTGAACLGSFATAVVLDELRFQTSRAERARGPRRTWPKKVLWAPPCLVPLLFALALVPLCVIYLLARWTLVALSCGTMGQQEKEKLHRESVDKLIAYIHEGAPLASRRARVDELRRRRRLRQVHSHLQLLRDAPHGFLHEHTAALEQAGGAHAYGARDLLAPRPRGSSSLNEPVQRHAERRADHVPPSTARLLRAHAVGLLLRLVAREQKIATSGISGPMRKASAESARDVLGLLLCQAGHLKAAPAAEASKSRRQPNASAVTSACMATSTTAGTATPAAAYGGVDGRAPDARANSNMARGLESRSLRWLLLLFVSGSPCHDRSSRASARLTLRTQRLGPLGDGRLSGLLQVGASVSFVVATVLAVLWAILTVPLLLLSVAYPLLQPCLYAASGGEDDGQPPILAPILSACCGLCVLALLPLRLSRRLSLRITLSNTLINLCESRRLTDAMLLAIEQRCAVAICAAAEEEARALPPRTTSTAATTTTTTAATMMTKWVACAARSRPSQCHRLLDRVRFDDDCSLCFRKIESVRGVRLFLDAAFLGPSAVMPAGPQLPHLPEPIRRQIYDYTRAGPASAAITLDCGHRFHLACWEQMLEEHRERDAFLREHPMVSQAVVPSRTCPECEVMRAFRAQSAAAPDSRSGRLDGELLPV